MKIEGQRLVQYVSEHSDHTYKPATRPVTENPSKPVTEDPSKPVTVSPTENPTKNPTVNPSQPVTVSPTVSPTQNPTVVNRTEAEIEQRLKYKGTIIDAKA